MSKETGKKPTKGITLSSALMASLQGTAVTVDEPVDLAPVEEPKPAADAGPDAPALETPPATTPAPVVPPVTAPEAQDGGLATFLRDELKTVRAENSAQLVELTTLRNQNTALELAATETAKGVEQMNVSLRSLASRLAVPLGLEATALDALGGADLAAKATSMLDTFNKRFPVGAKATTAADTVQTPKTPSAAPGVPASLARIS